MLSSPFAQVVFERVRSTRAVEAPGRSTPELQAAATPQPIAARTWALIAALTLVHAAAATCVALYSWFPSNYDELAHISLIKSMAEAPQVFLHYGQYRLLDAGNLARWTAEPNYLAHPSLYYLLMSPLFGWTSGNIVALRLANVVLSSAALAFAATAGARLIDDHRVRISFLLLLFCFPKAPVIGGIVSNDNLVLLASALFLWGCGSPRHRHLWIAAALVLAGWAKLTALIALGAVAGFMQAEELFTGRGKLIGRDNVWLLTALVAGFLPYLVNRLSSGRLLFTPMNKDWIIPLGQRVSMNVIDFTALFFNQLAAKYPAMDGMLPFALPLAGLVAVAFLALRGERRGAALVARCSMLALLVFTAIHIVYAWHTFQVSGRETADAQIRYYNVLWPGFALALALGSRKLGPRAWPVVTTLVVAAAAVPTILGFMLLQG